MLFLDGEMSFAFRASVMPHPAARLMNEAWLAGDILLLFTGWGEYAFPGQDNRQENIGIVGGRNN